MTTANEVINFNPNYTLCGKMPTQTVKLTFGNWDYRRTIIIDLVTNCTGLSVIEYAIEKAYETLNTRFFYDSEINERREVAHIILTKQDRTMDRLVNWKLRMKISMKMIGSKICSSVLKSSTLYLR